MKETGLRFKQTGRKSKQQGAFAIEFAIVGLLCGVLIVFASDIIIKISMKGKLDRLSYSAVSLIRERTQLYDEYMQMSAADVDLIYRVVSSSLSRTTTSFDSARFGMHIEEQTYDSGNNPNALVVFNRGAQVCTVAQTLAQREGDLSVVTTWGRKSALYRVTLCYETENLVAGIVESGFTRVSSTSVSLGR